MYACVLPSLLLFTSKISLIYHNIYSFSIEWFKIIILTEYMMLALFHYGAIMVQLIYRHSHTQYHRQKGKKLQ